MVLSLLLISAMILAPNPSLADCLLWLACPYVEDSSDPKARYLAIYDADLTGIDAKLDITEVAGTGLGRSIVCVESATIRMEEFQEVAEGVGCIPILPENVRSLMVSPYSTGLNPRTGQIELKDGSSGRVRDKVPIHISPNIRDQLTGRNQ